MKKAVKVILLSLGIIVLLAAAGVGIWLLTKKEAPIENEDQPKKGNVLGVEWYDEDGTEFTLNTIEELREFAALSEHYDFEGQTIKLGADIVDNEGNAADWEDVIPEHLWKPIQHFAGTFDGQGHTISGICSYGFVYIVRDAKTIFCKAGMFTDTKAACTIRDFRIVNSFFYGDFNEGTGSVASNGGGTFDSIYSSAIVVSYKENTGGIVGILDAKGAHTVTNCWFDGILRVEGNVGHYAGGIVGQVGPTGGTCKIEHCLNTGSLSSTLVNTGVNLGGIAGVIMDAGRVYVRDCLAVGDLTNDYSIAVGSVIGQVAGAASISDVYAVRESYKAIIGYKAGSIIGYPIEYTKKMLSGNGGYQWTTLDFDEYWSVVEGSTPVLKYFADSSPSVAGIEKKYDTDWYQKELTEFLITNEKELYGLAIVSRTTDFAGKTVILGADIVVNEGNAADWAEEDPESCWVPIGTVDYPFKGTFDGQMHSISGICYKTNANYSGLFSTTTDVTVIQNMKLLNSYFDFGGQSSGSIAGRGRGKFDTIYSSAIVSGRNINLGGLVGQIPGDGGIVMNNCWFDGQLTNTSNSLSTRYTGGLVGVVLSDSLMSNCLNTGTVDATNFTTPNPNNAANIVPLAAGLIGYIPTGKTMTIRGCLNAGDINVNEVASIGFGSIAGYVDGSARVSDTYAVAESAGLHSMAHCLTGEVAVLERSALTGYSAYQKTLLDFDEYWAVAENDTPVLKSFAENTPSLDGVEKIYDVSWYSIEADTYVLDSPEDLYGFALMSYNTDFSGKTIKLGANVVLNKGQASTWSQNAPENEWIQIGKTSKAFAGTFDGQWHRISGVYLKTDDRFGGLFAKTTPTAVIRNLVLTNSYIEGTGGDCGSIVGRGEGGSFSSIYSSATVVCSNSRVGGLFGQLYGDRVTINNCWFAGRVVGTGNSTSARTTGGILGLFAAKTGSMTNCLNTGVVNTSAYTYNQRANGSPLVVPLAGGIIGHLWENCNLLIENSLNSGKILVSPIAEEGNVGFGAVYGWADGAVTLVNAYATTESSKRVSGGHASTVTGAIKQMDEAAIKGYDGYRWMELDFNRYWAVVVDNEATPDTDESGTPILMSFASTVPSLADVKKMYAFGWMDEAEGTEEDPYILMDAADLLGFAQLSLGNNFEGKFVKLGADIDLNPGFTASVDGFTDGNEGVPVEWTSIGSTSKYFKGTFDGDGHTISGLYQKTTNTSNVYLGLFAATSGVSTVKNFRLENSYIHSQGARFGSIAGNGDGNFEKIYSNAILVADGSHAAATGGMVGYFDGEKDVTYSNLHFDGILTGSAYWAGGILGRASSADGITLTIQDCRNSGSLSSTDTTVGGILGLMDATDVTATVNITGSWNSGSIDVPSARGVFVGQIRNGAPTVNLTDCLNSFVPGSGAVNPVGSWRNGNLNYDCVLNVRASDVKTWSEDGTESSVSQITITSAAAEETLTPLGFDFENAWAVRSRYPVPIAFKAEEEETPDTGEDTYVLYSAEDLKNFAAISQTSDFEGKTVLLGADIDLNPGFTATVSGFTDGNDGTPVQWTSIGSAACFFKGTFDGQGHKISGLYQTTASTSSVYLGLFAATGGTSMVKNLRLENSYILSKGARFGSIAGCGDGNFENIYSNAVIVAEGGYAAAAGGMIGYFDGSANVTYSNLHFDGTLTGSAYWAGGILGRASSATGVTLTILNCRNSGSLSSTDTTVGGILGLMDATDATAAVDITGCWNSGAITVPSARGAFVGQLRNGTPTINLTDSLNSFVPGSGAINPVGSWKNGSFNYKCVLNVRSSDIKIWNESGTESAGTPASIAGEIAEETLTPFGFDFENAWAVRTGHPVPIAFASSEEETPDTEEETIVLNTAEDLINFALQSQTSNFENKTVKLGADIDLNPGFTASVGGFTDGKGGTPVKWTSIGSTAKYFKGTFDGDGHTISGLYQTTTSTSSVYLGLFGATSGASTVKNFRLENSYIYTKGARVGSIAGSGDGSFEDIYSNAVIVTEGGYAAAIGGMIGYFDGSANVTYSNLHFDGTLTGSAYWAGGILGRASGATGVTLTIKDCRNSGTLSSSDTILGGILGLMDAADATATVDITGCWNSGSVTVPSARGVFVGMIRNGLPTVNLTDCLNSFVPGSGGVNPVGSWKNGNLNYNCVLNVRAADFKVWNASGEETYGELETITSSSVKETLTPLGFDFETAWAVMDDYPVPAAFAE